MKAAILNGYNKNGCDLEIRDIPIPKAADNEVLVKIRTAGVNPLDNMIVHGEVKLIVPYSFPLVMGNEFVGIIEKTGAAVKNFSEGDRVYGRMPLKKIGAFAEYAAIDQRAIAKVPEYLSDEEATCVPLTALTALQAFELMQLKEGETVFISGGTGSLVSLRGLPNGEFAARSGMSFIKRMMFKLAGSKYDKMAAAKGQKYFFIFVHEDGAGLDRPTEIFKDTHLEASVDEVFSLDDVNMAMKKVASGGSKGKTILKIS